MSRLETIICRLLGRLLYAAFVLSDFIRGIKPPAPKFNHVSFDVIDEATGEVVRKEKK